MINPKICAILLAFLLLQAIGCAGYKARREQLRPEYRGDMFIQPRKQFQLILPGADWLRDEFRKFDLAFSQHNGSGQILVRSLTNGTLTAPPLSKSWKYLRLNIVEIEESVPFAVPNGQAVRQRIRGLFRAGKRPSFTVERHVQIIRIQLDNCAVDVCGVALESDFPATVLAVETLAASVQSYAPQRADSGGGVTGR